MRDDYPLNPTDRESEHGMSATVQVIPQEAIDPPLTLAPGAWDLVSFFENAKDYVGVAGGAFISLLGLVLLVVAAFFIVRKFMGGQSAQQDSWVKIAVMILIGGALMVGGISLLTSIASGGEQTIKDLGGGVIHLSALIGR